MSSEALLVEAWLKAGVGRSDEIGCAGGDEVRALADGELPETEARRLVMHISGCSSCRRALARLAAERTLPEQAALSDLLAGAGAAEAWSMWLRRLVRALPLDEDEVGGESPPGYEERTPLRIDDRGRLIVDVIHTGNNSGSVRLALTGEGTRLDLCVVAVRSGSLYAVVDLSALHPRTGVLHHGALLVEAVPVAASTAPILPILATLQDEAIEGVELWDRLAPIAALGERLREVLANELAAADSDQTVRASRLRGGAAGRFVADNSPIGRVQYALSALEEFAALWKECNGSELEGAAMCAEQLRRAILPVEGRAAEQSAVPASVRAASVRTTRQ